MIAAQRTEAQIKLAAEALLLQKSGAGARFPSPEELQSISVLCVIFLELEEEALKPKEEKKTKVKGLYQIENEKGEISYQIMHEPVSAPSQGIFAF